MNYINYAEVCKQIREMLKITQYELAKMIGTNQTEISFIERGFIPKANCKLEKIMQIANELQIAN
jgi:DNA-binding XRE family transcriptional regulator